MDHARRESWVDIAKGMSIILVVMMYATYNTGEYTGQTGFMHYVIGFATPFRMPEFFTISGLFLARVVARPWRAYADRRAVHYLYFYALWAFIMIGLKVGLYTASPTVMARELAVALVEPYGVLWFIYMLAVFSVAAKLAWQLRIPHWVVIAVAAGLQMAQIASPSYAVTQFCAYFVFFYAGYVAAPLVFRLADWAARNPAGALVGLAAWALVNGLLVYSPGYAVLPSETVMGYAAFPPLHLALGFAGALALCVAGVLLSAIPAMDWLRWLGEHSLVVYLAFTIPMSISRGLALWSGILTATGPLSLAVLVVSVASPVALYLLVKRFGIGTFLFERPSWARIAEARHAAPQPAEALGGQQ